MELPLVVLGDRTDHGGTVLTGDAAVIVEGRPVACVGDMVACPRCKGVFPIVTGAPNMFDSAGRAVARHTDKTACGARLLASQTATVWEDESLMDPEPPPPPPVSSEVATPMTSGICLDCLRKAAEQGATTVVRE